MYTNNSATKETYFDADRPIERKAEDRLNRGVFADSIARHIQSVPLENGFTVAVTGQWGAGKTSVLNMVSEALQSYEADIAVVNFNPWLFRGTEDLVTRFFQELSAQLEDKSLEKLKDVAKVVAQLGKSLAPFSGVPGLGIATELADKIVDKWAEPRSLFKDREHLRIALNESQSRVVVLIDDIDRLEGGETRDLMRLVRLTSDLPYVVFLLAFDRRRVATCLGESEAEGQIYLEKIVQVSYDLPVPREASLSDIFFPSLDETLRDRDLLDLDREIWTRVYYGVIKPLLLTFRDVKRYVHSLPVTLDTIGREVALADLLGLEALRILRPNLFNELKAKPENLVRTKSDWKRIVGSEERKKEIKSDLSNMMDSAGSDRKVLESALEILFPATQEFVGFGSFGSNWDKIWRRDRRVASEEALRIYLSGGLDDAGIPAREIRELVDEMKDGMRFTELLDALDDQRLEITLESLEDFEDEFTTEGARIAVPIIVNQTRRLSWDSGGLTGFSPQSKAARVIYRLLRKVEDSDTLASYIDEMITKVNGLSEELYLIEMVGHRKGSGHGLINEDKASELEKQMLEKLKTKGPDQLQNEWDLMGLLSRPLRWSGDDIKNQLERNFVEYLEQDAFVRSLLRSAVIYSYSNTRPREKHLPWQALMDTFGPDFVRAIDRLSESQTSGFLTDDDLDMIKIAQEYAEGKRKELPLQH